ncbi:hypothetical protein MUO79_11630 [Candidatus Bathyarchaeota archaeon]|nr:hypothetical protein [Candidatus Bathyarchaeota archaeon]
MSTTKSTLTRLSVAWLVMWAISYFAVAAIAPGISGDPNDVWLYAGFGGALLVGVILTQLSSEILSLIGDVVLCLLAGLSVGSGVASWAGVVVWNVPFADKVLFQVSMAFADLISAVFMFALVLEDY